MGRLAELRRAPFARYDAFDSRRPTPLRGCLPGTRITLLSEVLPWVERIDHGAPTIYWLNGMAGTGKSTIAYTVAKMADDAGLLGATFFFSKHGDATLSDPTLVFTTIAYQLAEFDSSQEFKRCMVEALNKKENRSLTSATAPGLQFSKLIEEPLRQSRCVHDRVVLVVLDALDECEIRGAEEILRSLVEVASTKPFPFHLKFFITSRPEAHITSILRPSQALTTVLLHNIEASIVGADIRLYLQHKLAEIWRKLGTERGLPEDWVSQTELEALTRLSGKLFVFAATSIRVIGDQYECDPRGQLEVILQYCHSSTVPSFEDLDRLYAEILKRSVPSTWSLGNTPARFFTRFRDVVSMVILLQEPLPMTAMDRLANRAGGDVRAALRHLHSVIFTPSYDGSPQTHHPSFPDFVCSKRRCIRAGLDRRFVINIPVCHRQFALWCFGLLSSVLSKQILGELDPEIPNIEIGGLKVKLEEVLRAEGRLPCIIGPPMSRNRAAETMQ